MLAPVVVGRVILMRHAMPVVQPDTPPARWRLGPEGLAAARDLRPALPEHAYLVASDEPKAIETLAEASGGAPVTIDADFGESGNASRVCLLPLCSRW